MLKIPDLIFELVANGRWPRDREAASLQYSQLLSPPERIAELAPRESKLYLEPPPFRTIRELSEANDFWFDKFAAPEMIDFDLAILIGDFGWGTDAPILLDYRAGVSNPRVIRLEQSLGGSGSKWVTMAENIEQFVRVLGL